MRQLVLAQAAFGVYVPTTNIPTRGIDGPLAPAETQVWRLIARAVRAMAEELLVVESLDADGIRAVMAASASAA